ncbi:MAG: hypothetical protein CM15mP46_5090 [Alphaproteobacteria bacterium]|nr:MAG: hypothetical protein CM15mP46_5090 [Alphaproteobacteria bacterium]
MAAGLAGLDHLYGLLPVIRPVSHLLPIRHLIICHFFAINAKSGHLNVNKNNCHFTRFIFCFGRFGILPDWLNNRYYPERFLDAGMVLYRPVLNSAATTKDIYFYFS